MGQINMHTTPEFDEMLRRFMRVKQLKSKSEALRTAIREGLEQAFRDSKCSDFNNLVGIANGVPENSKPQFKSHDDIWGN